MITEQVARQVQEASLIYSAEHVEVPKARQGLSDKRNRLWTVWKVFAQGISTNVNNLNRTRIPLNTF